MSRRQRDVSAIGLEGDDSGGVDLKAPSEFRVPVPKAIAIRWGFEPVYGVKGGSRKFARVTVRAVAGGSSEAMEGEAWFSSTYEMKLGENPARVASLRAVRFLRRAKLTQQLSEALFRLAGAAPCAPSSPALFSTSLLPLYTSVPVASPPSCLYSETVHPHPAAPLAFSRRTRS